MIEIKFQIYKIGIRGKKTVEFPTYQGTKPRMARRKNSSLELYLKEECNSHQDLPD